MIKAKLKGRQGQPILFIGLTGENITRLVAGEPIKFAAAPLGIRGLQDTTIGIAYGKTQADILSSMARDQLTDRIENTNPDLTPPLQRIPDISHINIPELVYATLDGSPQARREYLNDPVFHMRIQVVIGILERIMEVLAATCQFTEDGLDQLARGLVDHLAGDRTTRSEDFNPQAEIDALGPVPMTGMPVRPDPHAVPPGQVVLTVGVDDPTFHPLRAALAETGFQILDGQVTLAVGVDDPTFHAPAHPDGINTRGLDTLRTALAQTGFQILDGPDRPANLPG